MKLIRDIENKCRGKLGMYQKDIIKMNNVRVILITEAKCGKNINKRKLIKYRNGKHGRLRFEKIQKKEDLSINVKE